MSKRSRQKLFKKKLGQIESESEAWSNHIVIPSDTEPEQPQGSVISAWEPESSRGERGVERVEPIDPLMNGSIIEAQIDPSLKDKVLGTVFGPFGFDVDYWCAKKELKRRDE